MSKDAKSIIKNGLLYFSLFFIGAMYSQHKGYYNGMSESLDDMFEKVLNK